MSMFLAQEILRNAVSIVKAATEYSDSTKFRSTTGYSCMKIVIGTTCSVVITQQCSTNNVVWYDPIDISATALGTVGTFKTAGTYYVQFSPVMAPYIRFKLVEGDVAASAITLELVYQEASV